MKQEVLIVCAGNSLLADDAAGCEVFDRLSRVSLPDGVRLEKLGCVGIGLLEYFDAQEFMVVVDAVHLGAAPGTVHLLDWDTLPAAFPAPVSAHGVHLREAIEVARRLQPSSAPKRAVLVGIEGACFDQVGAALTPAVADAVPRAAQVVLGLICRKTNHVRGAVHV
jgi:hydrogenase maturation protease